MLTPLIKAYGLTKRSALPNKPCTFAWTHLGTDWPVLRAQLSLMTMLALTGFAANTVLAYWGLKYTQALKSRCADPAVGPSCRRAASDRRSCSACGLTLAQLLGDCGLDGRAC